MGTHNEFLRLLIGNGIFGLGIYLFLMGYVGLRLVGTYRREASPINIAALMVFAWWLVDCTGLHPGMYPYEQWIVWGFIGCALTGAPELGTSRIRLVLRPIQNRMPIGEAPTQPTPGYVSPA